MDIKIDPIQMHLLEEVSGLHEIPAGAYNIRANGKGIARNSSANIDIIPKDNGTGIDIKIKPGTKHESVHIPVVLVLYRRKCQSPLCRKALWKRRRNRRKDHESADDR